MTCPDFQGRTQLLSMLDHCIADHRGDEEITRRLADGLSAAIAGRSFELPAALRAPVPDCYARRLVHASPTLGYTVVAMVWGAGQGTAVHDHAGRWCVEGVVEGEIEVVQYDLGEADGDRCRFVRQATVHAGTGSTGSLIPPFEYHTIANPATDRSAVTLHVYAQELTECNIFQPLGDGWYQRQPRRLSYND